MKKMYLLGGLFAALSFSMVSCSDVDGLPKAEEQLSADLGTSYVISGKVTDANGASLSGVTVTGLSGVSTVNGTFSATATAGEHNLTFTKTGYKTYKVAVTLAKATAENPTVTAIVNAVLPEMESVTVAADADYAQSATVEGTSVEVVLPATGTEQNVEVAIYAPAAEEVVAETKDVTNEAVNNASPLAITVDNYTAGTESATLSIPMAGATSDYVELACVNEDGTSATVNYANGAYSVELPHFSTWTFNLKGLTKTVSVNQSKESAKASVSNYDGSAKNMNLSVAEKQGYTLSLTSSLPESMNNFIKTAIRNIQGGKEGVTSVTKSIPVAVSAGTKADYNFVNTAAEITYNVALNGGKTVSVKVVRYTGLKLNGEPTLTTIGHSGGSGK